MFKIYQLLNGRLKYKCNNRLRYNHLSSDYEGLTYNHILLKVTEDCTAW